MADQPTFTQAQLQQALGAFGMSANVDASGNVSISKADQQKMYVLPLSASDALKYDLILGYQTQNVNHYPVGGGSALSPEERQSLKTVTATKTPQMASDSAPEGQSGTMAFLASFANQDAHSVSQMQADLANAGLLQPESYRVGDGTDERTQAAILSAARVAQLKNISLSEAIAWQKAHPIPSETKEGKAASEANAQAKAAEDAYRSDLTNAYMKTWGINPPGGYIDRAMSAHMNVYEFQAHERSKPAFENSPLYQMERVNLNANIAQMTGRVKF